MTAADRTLPANVELRVVALLLNAGRRVPAVVQGEVLGPVYKTMGAFIII